MATVELRIMFLDIVGDSYRWYPLITLSIYVYDSTIEVSGEKHVVAKDVGAATRYIVLRLEVSLLFGASAKKSMEIASTPSLANGMAKFSASARRREAFYPQGVREEAWQSFRRRLVWKQALNHRSPQKPLEVGSCHDSACTGFAQMRRECHAGRSRWFQAYGHIRR